SATRWCCAVWPTASACPKTGRTRMPPPWCACPWAARASRPTTRSRPTWACTSRKFPPAASTWGAPMFDIGFDQAAGLRSDALGHGPSLMPLASPAQPALAYELLCKLATRLTALGDPVVIIDATATESASEQRNDGSPLGLLRALQDPSVSGLERPADGGEWLVMPGARGLQALQLTAAAGGADAALSRLFAPFASSVTVLLFAPAFDLAGLLSGLSGR